MGVRKTVGPARPITRPVVLTLLLTLVAFFGPATPHSQYAAAAPVGGAVLLTDSSDSELLPVNRWGDHANELHGRLGTFELTERIQRNATYPVLLSIGNSMFSGATGMTSAAVEFDILDAAGEQVDRVAAALGKALINSGVVAVLAVIALVAALWQVRKHGNGKELWTAIGKTALTVGVLGVMITGATQSTEVRGQYQPGTFSPGWIVTTTNDVVASLASAPAATLTVGDTGAGYSYDRSATGDMSCSQYVKRLKDLYKTQNPLNQMSNSVPIVMSGMWEATGLEVWSTSQFGADNPYGDYAYCRLLEQHAGTPAAEQREITLHTANNKLVNRSSVQSLAWKTAMNEQEDRTMIAWAQCRPAPDGSRWALAPGWADVTAGGGRAPDRVPDDCDQWWSKAAYFIDTPNPKFKDGDSAFEWADAEVINSDSGDPAVRNYLLTLHGHTGGGVTSSLAMVWSFMLASFVVLIVFGLISIAVIVAKVSMVVMIIAVVFALLLGMLPGRRSVAGKYFMVVLSLSIFVFALQLILGFVTLITSLMVAAGREMFGGGSMISMIWTGIAPAVGILVLHLIFTKALKIPSPFTLQGGQQWGQAAASGALGGAVASGMMNQFQSQGRQLVRRTGRDVASSAMSGLAARAWLTGGRGGARKRQGVLIGAGGGAASGESSAAAKRGERLWGWPGSTGPAKAAASGLAFGAGLAGPGTPDGDDDAGGRPTTAKTDPRSAVPDPAPDAPGEQRAPAGFRAARAQAITERRLAAAQETQQRNDLAKQRGAKNTPLGRHAEGLRARWSRVGQELGQKGLPQYLFDHTDAGIGKTVGAAALVVGTGGLAVPVMAAVWGTKQVRKSNLAQRDVETRHRAQIDAQRISRQQTQSEQRRREEAPHRQGTASGAPGGQGSPGAAAAAAMPRSGSSGRVRVNGKSYSTPGQPNRVRQAAVPTGPGASGDTSPVQRGTRAARANPWQSASSATAPETPGGRRRVAGGSSDRQLRGGDEP